MNVGVCKLVLRIPGSRSLKEKRQVLQSLQARVRQRFNVSMAEVDGHGRWGWATMAVCCVNSDAGYASKVLSQVVHFIESEIIGRAEVVERTTEVFPDLL
jgi:uncharacterized protein YlxP (DUF503 family)